MRIEDENFQMSFDEINATIFFKGTLRFKDMSDYTKINQFMLDAYDLGTPELNLDFYDLEFMNSAGISTLLNFIFEAKEMNKKPVRIIGNKNILWQNKSFANLKKIWEAMDLIFK